MRNTSILPKHNNRATLNKFNPKQLIDNTLTLIPKFMSAFTLAEVLITLGVIGVISAMTIPNLITKYQKITVEVKLKKILLNYKSSCTYDYCRTWRFRWHC